MRYVLLAIFASSCSPSQLERQACYGQAELRAAAAAEQQCFDRGYGWEACGSREEILATLKKEYEACP